MPVKFLNNTKQAQEKVNSKEPPAIPLCRDNHSEQWMDMRILLWIWNQAPCAAVETLFSLNRLFHHCIVFCFMNTLKGFFPIHL